MSPEIQKLVVDLSSVALERFNKYLQEHNKNLEMYGRAIIIHEGPDSTLTEDDCKPLADAVMGMTNDNEFLETLKSLPRGVLDKMTNPPMMLKVQKIMEGRGRKKPEPV
jgi:hypothetical protein